MAGTKIGTTKTEKKETITRNKIQNTKPIIFPNSYYTLNRTTTTTTTLELNYYPTTTSMTSPKLMVTSTDPQHAEGVTPLMLAALQGRVSDVKTLLRKNKDSVQSKTKSSKVALHFCAEGGSTRCFDLIIAADPSLVNCSDEEGYTPLHLAVINGHVEIVKRLITSSAQINSYDHEKHSLVHWATVCGELEILDILLTAGASATTPDIHMAHPIHYASQMCGNGGIGRRGDGGGGRVQSSLYGVSPKKGLAILQRLLLHGVPVDVKDRDGRQPLLWAASAGSADGILCLVNSGASVQVEDKDGLTALHCAASRGHTDCLETLIALCGAGVDVIDNNGCTAIFYAVTLGHADCTELLLNFGAEPNRQDRKGRTPAHCGASKGQLETIKLIDKHGGNLWIKNVRGDLPLHEAVISRRRDLVLWLLAQRTDSVNAGNNDGRCPIHLAALNNNVEMVKILIDHMADINPLMRTGKGIAMTPLDAAMHKGNSAVAKFLQMHGGLPANSLNSSVAMQRRLNRNVESEARSTSSLRDSVLSQRPPPDPSPTPTPDESTLISSYANPVATSMIKQTATVATATPTPTPIADDSVQTDSSHYLRHAQTQVTNGVDQDGSNVVDSPVDVKTDQIQSSSSTKGQVKKVKKKRKSVPRDKSPLPYVNDSTDSCDNVNVTPLSRSSKNKRSQRLQTAKVTTYDISPAPANEPAALNSRHSSQTHESGDGQLVLQARDSQEVDDDVQRDKIICDMSTLLGDASSTKELLSPVLLAHQAQNVGDEVSDSRRELTQTSATDSSSEHFSELDNVFVQSSESEVRDEELGVLEAEPTFPRNTSCMSQLATFITEEHDLTKHSAAGENVVSTIVVAECVKSFDPDVTEISIINPAEIETTTQKHVGESAMLAQMSPVANVADKTLTSDTSFETSTTSMTTNSAEMETITEESARGSAVLAQTSPAATVPDVTHASDASCEASPTTATTNSTEAETTKEETDRKSTVLAQMSPMTNVPCITHASDTLVETSAISVTTNSAETEATKEEPEKGVVLAQMSPMVNVPSVTHASMPLSETRAITETTNSTETETNAEEPVKGSTVLAQMSPEINVANMTHAPDISSETSVTTTSVTTTTAQTPPAVSRTDAGTDVKLKPATTASNLPDVHDTSESKDKETSDTDDTIRLNGIDSMSLQEAWAERKRRQKDKPKSSAPPSTGSRRFSTDTESTTLKVHSSKTVPTTLAGPISARPRRTDRVSVREQFMANRERLEKSAAAASVQPSASHKVQTASEVDSEYEVSSNRTLPKSYPSPSRRKPRESTTTVATVHIDDKTRLPLPVKTGRMRNISEGKTSTQSDGTPISWKRDSGYSDQVHPTTSASEDQSQKRTNSKPGGVGLRRKVISRRPGSSKRESSQSHRFTVSRLPPLENGSTSHGGSVSSDDGFRATTGRPPVATRPKLTFTKGENLNVPSSPYQKKSMDVDTPISVTQAMQASMRKYHLERKIFQELLELKRLQIRAGKANEQILVKRLADGYRKAGLSINYREFDGAYTFRNFEKYLYEQLRLLQANRKLLPRFAPSDDLEKLSLALKKMNATKLPFLDDYQRPQSVEDEDCTQLTHRCHHASHAYVGIPCAAYISKGRRTPFLPKVVNRSRQSGPTSRQEVSPSTSSQGIQMIIAPRREDTASPITVEVQQGSSSQVFTLPNNSLDPTKNYYVSLSIKPSPMTSSPTKVTTSSLGPNVTKFPPEDSGSLSAPLPQDEKPRRKNNKSNM